MAKRGMAMSATTKANIGAGRKTGLSLSGGGLGTSPFSQSSSLASKSVRKVNSEIKSKLAKRKKKGLMNMGKPQPNINTNKLKASPLQRKPIGKFAVAENYDATPSTPLTPQQKSLREIDKAKNRVDKRLHNYSTSSNSLPLIYFSTDRKDANWRRNLSLSLKRFWARKKPGRIEGNIPELQDVDRRVKAGESGISILLDPKLSGKTKAEAVGIKVGELVSKVTGVMDRGRDRVKDIKRGYTWSRRYRKLKNAAEKYNLEIVAPTALATASGAGVLLTVNAIGDGSNKGIKQGISRLKTGGGVSATPGSLPPKLRRGSRLGVATLGATAALSGLYAAKKVIGDRRKKRKFT